MPHNQLLEVTLANLGADDVSYVQRVNNIMTLCTSHVNNSHPIFRVFGGVPGLESVISAAKGLSMRIIFCTKTHSRIDSMAAQGIGQLEYQR
eukprot:COSAG01_NODE_77_length_28297_cov_104.096230_8_plen_92_part_00